MSLSAELKRLSNIAFQLEEDRDKLIMSLEALTPGGSEFHNDPQRCLDWISDRMKTVVNEVKKRKEAEAELEQLRSQPQVTPEVTAFLDAMEPIIANEEKLIGRQENKHICALFRAIVR